jgi:hypothetical protein
MATKKGASSGGAAKVRKAPIATVKTSFGGTVPVSRIVPKPKRTSRSKPSNSPSRRKMAGRKTY